MLRLDHVVLWVDDPLRSLAFYADVVGLPAERAEEFRAGKVPFPSVRISEDSLVDLMPRKMAAPLNGFAKAKAPHAASSAGHPVNHVCLAMSEPEYIALRERLVAAGVDVSMVMERSFGARGIAPVAFYFADPDGNVLEARHYG